jgi:hypothetical protein
MSSRMKKSLMVIGIYLIAVAVSIFFSFNFEGSINAGWTLVLFVLTLPWSFVTILFMWALIHGAGLEMFTVMFFSFAVINSFLIYLIFGKNKSAKIP